MSKAGFPKIQLTDVKKQFGSKIVLDGVTLTINKGESMVIIGGSGSGKSVTLKCILGLIQPDSGSIKIDGQETVDLDPKGRDKFMNQFGMLFQGGALFDSMKVWENVAFGLIQGRKMDRDQAHDIAIEKLKQEYALVLEQQRKYKQQQQKEKQQQNSRKEEHSSFWNGVLNWFMGPKKELQTESKTKKASMSKVRCVGTAQKKI